MYCYYYTKPQDNYNNKPISNFIWQLDPYGVHKQVNYSKVMGQYYWIGKGQLSDGFIQWYVTITLRIFQRSWVILWVD